MAEPTYYGDYTQISTGAMGIKPLARKGKVVVVDGQLQLFGGHDELIDQSPVGPVRVEKAKMALGTALWVHLDDRRYAVSIGGGKIWLRMLGFIPAYVVTSSNAKKFRAALEAEQQRVGGGAGPAA